MIRHPELIKKNKNSLENKVLLNMPDRKILLNPLDKIIPPIYDSHLEIHELQNKLSEEYIFSLDELIQANKIIQPAENAVDIMINSTYNHPSYEIAAAKITDVGNKLDNAIIRNIKNLYKEFKNKYHQIKKNVPSSILEQKRIELNNKTDIYFKIESIYNERNLPLSSISKIAENFNQYKQEANIIHSIKKEINELREKYDNINLDEVQQFTKYAIPLIKEGLFNNGKITIKCKKTNFYEGLDLLDSLRQELEYYSHNSRFLKTINNKISDTNHLIKSYNIDIDKYISNPKLKTRLEKESKKIDDVIKKIKNDNIREKYVSINNDMNLSIHSLDEKAEETREKRQNVIQQKKHIEKNINSIYNQHLTKIDGFYKKINDLIKEYTSINQKLNLSIVTVFDNLTTSKIHIKSIDDLINNNSNNNQNSNKGNKEHDIRKRSKNSLDKYVINKSISIAEIENKCIEFNDKVKITINEYLKKTSELRNIVSNIENKIKSYWINSQWSKIQNDYECQFSKINSELDLLINNKKLTEYENSIFGLIKQSDKVKKECIENLNDLQNYYRSHNKNKYSSIKNNQITSLNDNVNDNHINNDNLYSVNDGAIVGNGSFPLTLYMKQIGHPKNPDYLKLFNIITGMNGQKDWKSRFDKLSKNINNGLSIRDNNDKEYLTLLNQGIKKTIEEPPCNFDINSAKNAYNSLNKIIECVKI
jgi:hypothetical protein